MPDDANEPWLLMPRPQYVTTPEQLDRWNTCAEFAYHFFSDSYDDRIPELARALYQSDLPSE